MRVSIKGDVPRIGCSLCHRAMCGRAAISIPASSIVGAVVRAGVPLPPDTKVPSEYHVGSKSCEERTKRNPTGVRGVEGWPCLVKEDDGAALLMVTLKWGIQRLSTHTIWLDDDEWVGRKNWRAAMEKGNLCAVAVTAFVEGVTCRRSDDGLFFLAALFIQDKFILLTTNSCSVPLLRERAVPQAQYGVPTRCPLVLDAAAAQRWLETPSTVEATLAATRVITAAMFAGTSSPPLVLGIKGKGTGSPTKCATTATGQGASQSAASSASQSAASSASQSAASPASLPPAASSDASRTSRKRARDELPEATFMAASGDLAAREQEEVELQRAIALSLQETHQDHASPRPAARGASSTEVIVLNSDDDVASAPSRDAALPREERGSADVAATETERERMRNARLSRFTQR